MRTAISAVVIRRKKILLVRKNKTWILPGDKPQDSESDIGCLTREIEEELPQARLRTIHSFYNTFRGKSPHKGEKLEARVYIANISGDVKATAREISESRWVPYQETSKLKISDITLRVIYFLKYDKYL